MTLTPPRTSTPTSAWPPHPRRGARDVARGLAALLALLAMVIGTPLVLTMIAPVQLGDLHLPDGDEIAAALLRPDDGTLLLTVLTLVAWAGWALFTLLALAEAVAQARGLPTVRLPGLGAPQRAVTVLVAAVTVMLAPAASAADSAHAVPAVTTSAPGTSHAAGAGAVQTGWVPRAPEADQDVAAGDADRSPASRALPTVTVRTGDSLWELAERHLGSGTRYPEIADLNYDRLQPDGRALTRDHWIHPGWTLQLPAAATNLTGTRALAGGDYTVRAGDTLTGIAAEHLGDPDRYPELLDLNRGRSQDDGATLTDPDHIRPGWHLALPGDHADPPNDDHTQARTQAGPSDAVAPPGAAPSTTPAPTPSLRAAHTTPAPTSADPAAGVAPDPTGSTPTHPSTDPPPPLPAQSTSGDQDDWDLKAPLTALLAGLGGIAAAGVLREVALRRRRGQRRRRPGERLPALSPRAVETDRSLRAHQQPVTLDLLRSSLRALVGTCRTVGEPLPRITAALLNPDRIELHLADPHPHRNGDEALPPFRALGRRRWQLDPTLLCPGSDDLSRSVGATVPADAGDRDGEASDQDDLDSPGDDVTDPCPALVTIGTTGEDLVMINLEAAGTLTLTGDPDVARGVVRALAVELVTSPLTQDCEITLSPDLADLANVTDIVRARTAPDADTASLRTQAHHRDTATTWEADGVGDVLDARARNLAPDTWAPRIDLATGGDDEAVSAADPWSGRVLVRTATTPDVGQGWQLDLTPDSSGRLRPLGITVTPQRLDAENYAAVLDVLGPTDPEPVAPNRDREPDAAEQPREPVPLRPQVSDPVTTGDSQLPAPEPIRTPEPALLGASLRDALRNGHPVEPASAFDSHTSAVLDALPIYDELMARRTVAGGQRVEVIGCEPALRPVGAAAQPPPDLRPRKRPDPKQPTPRILLLGPVEVVGADDSVLPERRRRFIELIAYLALHPGGSRHALDEAMWPGARVPGDTRNAMVSRARKWLGEAPDGRPFLLPYNSADGYRLHPDITTDWHDFLALSHRGLEAGPGGIDDLTAAVNLVRGRPFHGIDPRDYAWADPDIQEMISTIGDVAHAAAQCSSGLDDSMPQVVTRALRLVRTWS